MSTPYTVHWKSAVTGNLRSSGYATKAEALRDARALQKEGARNVSVSHYHNGTVKELSILG